MHVCMLVGYHRTMARLPRKAQTFCDAYLPTVSCFGTTGVLKIMSKMGISLLSSYQGAQIFEAIGIGEDLLNLGFRGTPSRLGGLETHDLACETASFMVGIARTSSSCFFRVEALHCVSEVHTSLCVVSHTSFLVQNRPLGEACPQNRAHSMPRKNSKQNDGVRSPSTCVCTHQGGLI